MFPVHVLLIPQAPEQALFCDVCELRLPGSLSATHLGTGGTEAFCKCNPAAGAQQEEQQKQEEQEEQGEPGEQEEHEGQEEEQEETPQKV